MSQHRQAPWIEYVCILAGSWLAGCGTQDAQPDRHDLALYERLGLTRVGGEEVASRTPVFEAGRGASRLRVEAERVETRTLNAADPAPAVQALDAYDSGRVSIAIPGPHEPGAFYQVAMTLVSSKTLTMHVQISQGDELQKLPTKILKGNPAPQTLLLDAPLDRRRAAPIDELAVLFMGRPAHVQILSVALIRQPWSALFGSPARTAMVSIGEDYRRVSTLDSKSPCELSLEVQPNTNLEFVYGQPEDLRRRGEQPSLRVTLSAEGDSDRVLSFPMEPDIMRPAAWRSASLSLSDLADQRVNVRFELVVEGAGEGLCTLGEPTITRRNSSAPTVILITSDTHRADHVGVADMGVDVRTPFLDGLAARGVFFEDCLSPANATRPSHATILTGIPPRDTGVISNVGTLPQQALTLPEVFREAGYMTWAAVSVDHLTPGSSGLGQGFDRSLGSKRRDSKLTVEVLANSLPDADGLPMFLWLHLFDSHAPYDPGEDYERLYYPRDKDPCDPALPELPGSMRIQWRPDVRDLDFALGLYKGEVTYQDERLGELFESPRLSAAIVAFTADHGESLTAHGIYWRHTGLYPDTVQVPLILAWPGAPAGMRIPRGVQNADVGRTLLDLAGLAQHSFPGTNLMRESASGPRFVIANGGISAAVFMGDRLLVLDLRDAPKTREQSGGRRSMHAVQLFDLAQDPGCLLDLASERPKEARKLRGVLVRWLLDAEPERVQLPRGHEDQEELLRLGEMGYATGLTEPVAGTLIDSACDCENCQTMD